MATLDVWIVHRSAVLGLSWPKDVADLCGVEPAALAPLAAGDLRRVGRSARGYLARALKVSVRDIEALAAGRIAWIDDARRVEADWLRPAMPRPPARGAARPCKPSHGIPILGRILGTGRVEHDETWTPEDGRRLAFRYSGVADPFALQLQASLPPHQAGSILVFQTVLPGQLRAGDLSLITCGERETETELGIVYDRAADALWRRTVGVMGGDPKRVQLADILRSARVIGSHI